MTNTQHIKKRYAKCSINRIRIVSVDEKWVHFNSYNFYKKCWDAGVLKMKISSFEKNYTESMVDF